MTVEEAQMKIQQQIESEVVKLVKLCLEKIKIELEARATKGVISIQDVHEVCAPYLNVAALNS